MLQLGLAALLAAPLPWTPAPETPWTPIYGGTTVADGEWSSAVAIVMPGTLCTGTLVAPRIVLTAAHCLVDNPPVGAMEIRLGSDVNSVAVPRYGVARYGSHPMFCGTDTEVCKEDIWDYGYIELLQDVAGVQPTRPLTSQDAWDEAMQVGGTVTLVGYGLSDDGGDITGIKREVDVPIVRFSGTGLEFQAGGDGRDSCQGDSGGPAFVTLASGEVLLGGITSRGYSCGKGGFYAIPYAALCWLSDETGVDLRTDACETCDCLVTTAPEEDGCGCAANDAGGPLALGLLVLLSRPGRRRSRTYPT